MEEGSLGESIEGWTSDCNYSYRGNTCLNPGIKGEIMSDGVKIMALGCLTVCFCVSLALGYDEPKIWGTILGLFSLIVGGGTAGKNAVKHILRIDK